MMLTFVLPDYLLGVREIIFLEEGIPDCLLAL